MKEGFFVGRGVVCALVVSLAACATPEASQFGGRWKPVNQFSHAAVAIPIYPDYVYQASPMDRTLMRLLQRWAKDSNMELAYQVGMDYTLYTPVANVTTADIASALQQMNDIYKAQGIEIQLSGNRIVVSGGRAAPTSS